MEKFILPADFMVLYCKIEQEVSIILGYPFLAIGRAIVNLDMGKIKFRVQEDEVSFKIFETSSCVRGGY